MTAAKVADRFAAGCAWVSCRLPFRLSRAVPGTLLGFAVINLATFTLDLSLVRLLHGQLDWPVPIAFGTSYIIAFTASFFLNRFFNFHSHAPMGRQGVVYAAVVVVNYFGLIVGAGTLLTVLGVDYLVSRVLVGVAEGVFMYCSMRWLVFPRRREHAQPSAVTVLDGPHATTDEPSV